MGMSLSQWSPDATDFYREEVEDLKIREYEAKMERLVNTDNAKLHEATRLAYGYISEDTIRRHWRDDIAKAIIWYSKNCIEV